tara:strand:- start:739 stop:2058 length:1320 start_codon:yes stop_codon:yes gene_type:complete
MVAIKDVASDTEALNMATELFGAEGAQRMSVAIRDGTVDVDELAATLGEAEGTVNDMTESTMTSSEKLSILTNKFKLAIEPVAGFATSFGPLLYILPAAMAALSGILGVLKLSNIVMAGAAIKTGALAIAKGIATAATWLLVAAQAVLHSTMLPIILVIAGIAAAIVAGIVIWKNWDKIIAFVTETFGKLDDFLSDKFPATWQFLKDYISTIVGFWKDIFKGFVALFKGDWDGAIDHFKDAFGRVKDFFVSVIDGLWSKLDDFMTNKFGGAWETAKDVVGAAVSFISDLFSGLVETLGGIWDLIIGLFTGDTDKIKEGFKGIVNGVLSMFNALIKMVNKIGFTMPEWLGGKSFNMSIPEIPQLAEGGIVKSPTLAMIGESGAEAVVPLNGTGGGVGGVTVNIQMPAGGTVILDDESTAQRFGDFISEQVRQVLRTQGAF